MESWTAGERRDEEMEVEEVRRENKSKTSKMCQRVWQSKREMKVRVSGGMGADRKMERY